MSGQDINGKVENLKEFSSLGWYNCISLNTQKSTKIKFSKFSDKDAQDLIYSAIEARQFSYRYVVYG